MSSRTVLWTTRQKGDPSGDFVDARKLLMTLFKAAKLLMDFLAARKLLISMTFVRGTFAANEGESRRKSDGLRHEPTLTNEGWGTRRAARCCFERPTAEEKRGFAVG